MSARTATPVKVPALPILLAVTVVAAIMAVVPPSVSAAYYVIEADATTNFVARPSD